MCSSDLKGSVEDLYTGSMGISIMLIDGFVNNAYWPSCFQLTTVG